MTKGKTNIVEQLEDICDWIMMRCDMIGPCHGNTVIALEVKTKLEKIIIAETLESRKDGANG